MSEQSPWDITSSDFSKKDVRLKVLAKNQKALQDKFISECFIILVKSLVDNLL